MGMEPKKVVVSGFATLDYVVQSSEPFNGTGTVLSELGVANAWPRAGGAALYASRRIAAAGHRSFALTWIGDDGDGGHYLRACQRDQICREAIQQNRGFKLQNVSSYTARTVTMVACSTSVSGEPKNCPKSRSRSSVMPTISV